MQNLTQYQNQYQTLQTFRKGNKLLRRLINSMTNPLGIPENAEREFHTWVDKQTRQINFYFNKAAHEGIEAAEYKYHRPIFRGQDGYLYSPADMDNTMMSN